VLCTRSTERSRARRHTTDANGNGGGTFTFQGTTGQVQGFDTQVTTDGTDNGIVYYTSAQTAYFTLP
jgi:hypothetical protein